MLRLHLFQHLLAGGHLAFSLKPLHRVSPRLLFLPLPCARYEAPNGGEDGLAYAKNAPHKSCKELLEFERKLQDLFQASHKRLTLPGHLWDADRQGPENAHSDLPAHKMGEEVREVLEVLFQALKGLLQCFLDAALRELRAQLLWSTGPASQCLGARQGMILICSCAGRAPPVGRPAGDLLHRATHQCMLSRQGNTVLRSQLQQPSAVGCAAAVVLPRVDQLKGNRIRNSLPVLGLRVHRQQLQQ
mmetsp:Transcript_58102/g.135345  ORF Transcript_58102/g.135345 Transcript_58102/m.135345 type:complete len:245 (+) Transcript_58102:270-1004(+)